MQVHKISRLSRSANSLKMLFKSDLHRQGKRADLFCRTFSECLLGDPSIECFMAYRARVLLWATIRAMGLTATDEVIIPAYTCEAVPMAVRFAGAKCVYVDCKENDWNPDIEALLQAVTPQTRLLLLQHTYGIVQQAKALREKLPDQVEILEDACQVVEHARLLQNRAYTLGSLFSLQWNKPLTTGFGGILSVHNKKFAQCLKSFLSKNLDKNIAAVQVRGLICQMAVYQALLTPVTRALLSKAYRSAQKYGFMKGTIIPEDYDNLMPIDYPAAVTDVQAVWGLDALNEWPGTLSNRREISLQYIDYFSKHDIPKPPGANNDDALWAVPVRINDKFTFMKSAEKRNLAFGYWFGRLPVHLSPPTAAKYGYHVGSSPYAEKMIMQEIFLSTGPDVSMKLASQTAEYLFNHRNMLS